MFQAIRFPLSAALAALLAACGGGGGGNTGETTPPATPAPSVQRYAGSWVGRCKNTPNAVSKSQGELLTVAVGRDGSAALTRELRTYAEANCQNTVATLTNTRYVFRPVDAITLGGDTVDRVTLVDQATGSETKQLVRLKDGQWVESQAVTGSSYPTQLDTSNHFVPVLLDAVANASDRYINTRWIGPCQPFGNNQWTRGALNINGRSGDALLFDENAQRYSDSVCTATVSNTSRNAVMRFGYPVQIKGEAVDRVRIFANLQSVTALDTLLLLRRANVLLLSNAETTTAWDAEGYPTGVDESRPYKLN